MFGVGGEHDLSERTLPHLAGWKDSRPVRVGNGAWSQQQVDVYGELLDAAHRLHDQIGELGRRHPRVPRRLRRRGHRAWREADQGIWEVRGDARHFLYSKVMCWVALDRAIAMAARIGAEDKIDEWTGDKDEIFTTVVRDGWSEAAGAFTQYFGSEDLDASNLMLPIVGFLPATHPRMKATIDAIAERLTDERGLVYRYRTEGGVDGLAGEEGTFLLCTFWLAQAQAMAGELDRARQTFENGARLRQRRGPARRGGRPGHRRDARQLPAGVQPHRPGERRLRDQPGRAGRGKAGRQSSGIRRVRGRRRGRCPLRPASWAAGPQPASR